MVRKQPNLNYVEPSEIEDTPTPKEDTSKAEASKADQPKFLSPEEVIKANEKAAAEAIRSMARTPPAEHKPSVRDRPAKASKAPPMKKYRVTEDRKVRVGASDITFRCGKILLPTEFDIEHLKILGVKIEEISAG